MAFYLRDTFGDKIIAHALRDAPNECCGLLAGVKQQGNQDVQGIYPIRNLPADDPLIGDLSLLPDPRFRYAMDPKEQFLAFRAMHQQGWELVGIYHSHPHSEAYPSATDIRLAYYPDVTYLIVSLEQKECPKIRAFRVMDGKVLEDVIVHQPTAQ